MTQVLVVEDNQAVTHIYRTLFESHGLSVTAVSTGEAGLQSVKTSMPAAVLLDLRLPKMTGIELLREIRCEPGGQTLPIIVSTSSLSKSVVDEASIEGATQVLEKAYNPPKKIVEVVLEALGINNQAAANVTPKHSSIKEDAEKPAAPAKAQPLSVESIVSLIEMLMQFPFDDEQTESTVFHEELARHKSSLSTANESIEIDIILSSLATSCSNYFHRARFFLQE